MISLTCRPSIPDNPCIGVKLNREAPRERYVTDDEFETVLRMAPPPISQMMELSAACSPY